MGSLALALLVVMQGSPAEQPAHAIAARRAVEALERQWLSVEDDPAALDAILADDFIHVLPQGMITKREQLAFMRAHPTAKDGTARRFADLRVRVFGTAAVATGIVVATAPDGTAHKTAFTDVFAYLDGRWRAVNAQETPMR